MIALNANGYLHSTDQAGTQAAAEAISASWLDSIDSPEYKATTERWSTVKLATDGSGTYYTEKHPDDAHNVAARAINGISEGAGDVAWFPVED